MYKRINLEAFTPFQHLHVPAVGGLELVSPKTTVAPGSLIECLNYEVVSEPGYKLCDGILQYVGKGISVPVRYIKAQIGSSANINSFVIGGIYPLGVIGVLNVDVIAKVQYLGKRTEDLALEIDYAYFIVVEGDVLDTKSNLSNDLMIFMSPVLVEE